MAPFHLLPRDERFVALFQDAAKNVAEAAAALSALLNDLTHVETGARRIEELEHVGDRLTHQIFDALNRAFVTPFDRQDIAELASALDDVIDDAEEAARRLCTYRIERPSALAVQLTDVLLEQCHIIEQAIPLLDGLRDVARLQEHIIALHRLENDADELLNQALGGLYKGVREVPELIAAIQWGDIYSILERATDRAEAVAVVLETIVVKHS
jgi:predicted phosphate transport protein (TIGR00153 family)